MEEIEISININGARQAKSELQGVSTEMKNAGVSATQSGGSIATSFIKAEIALRALSFAFNIFKDAAKAAWSMFTGALESGADLDRLRTINEVLFANLPDDIRAATPALEDWRKELQKANASGTNAENVINGLLRNRALLPMINDLKRLNRRTGEMDTGVSAFTLKIKDLSAAMGISSSEGINKFTEAIVAGKIEMLDQLGITANIANVYRDFAASLGKTSGELTDVERQQSLFNLIIKEAEKVEGAYEATREQAAKGMNSYKDAVKGLREEFGLKFQPMYNEYVQTILTGAEKVEDYFKNDAGFATFAQNINNAVIDTASKIRGVFQLLKTGDYTKAISELMGGGDEDEPWVRFLINARDTAKNVSKVMKDNIEMDDIMGILTPSSIMAPMEAGGFFDDIKEGAVAITELFKEITASSTFQEIVKFLDLMIEGIVEFKTGIGEGFMETWQTIKDIVVDELKPAFMELWANIGQFFGSANAEGDDFKTIMKDVGQVVGKVVGFLVIGFVKIVTWIIKAVNWFLEMREAVRMFVDTQTKKFEAFITKIESIPVIVKQAWEALKLHVQQKVNEIVLFIKSIPDKILFHIGETIANIVIGIKALPGLIEAGISAVVANIKLAFETAKEWVRLKLQEIGTFFTNLPQTAETAGRNIWQRLKDWVAKTKEEIGLKIEEIKLFFTTTLPDSIQEFRNKAVAFFRSIPDQIKASLNVLISNFERAINKILEGYNSVAKASKGAVSEIPPVKLGRLQAGTGSFRGGYADVGEYGRETLHLPQGARVTSSRAKGDIEANLMRQLVNALSNASKNVTINNPQFGGNNRGDMQQMNNFSNLLLNAI